MNTRVRALLAIAAIGMVTGCASRQATPGGGNTSGDRSAAGRAVAGDTVYLVEHFVRGDRREQFEQFVQQVLWPAIEKSAAADERKRRVLRQTRMLAPVAPNSDGSFTYTFVLDPVVPGESYSVFDFLRQAYTQEEALQHYQRFTDMWARDFAARPFVQAR